MATLTAKQREDLDSNEFALPETREYPIHDENHARAALAHVAKHGTPELQTKVKKAVAKKYPMIAMPKNTNTAAAQSLPIEGGQGGDSSSGEPGVLSACIDTPLMLDDSANGPATTQIVVAKLGKYQDKRYGTFQITPDDYEGWRANLNDSFNGRVPIDIDHAPEKGRGTEAAAWITNLNLDGDKVLADVEWTPLGERAVKERRYLYISPTFVQNWKDETGKARGRALIGAALTNRPFLRRDMPALTLSEEAIEETTLAENLPRVLADGFTLYLTAHGFHWNVRGQDFTEYHTLFGEIYEDVFESLDDWAEIMRKLDMDAPFRMDDFAQLREIDDAGPIDASPVPMAKQLLAANAQMLECLNETFTIATAHNEQGVANFAAERIDQHQKIAWKLRASIESENHMLTENTIVDSSDNPERMNAHDNIALALGLDADADSATIADAARTLSEDAPEGAITLTASTVAALVADAHAGIEARRELSDSEFKSRFDKAMTEGRVTPAQEGVFREIHSRDPELAAKTLDSLRPVVKTRADGDGTAAISEQAPEGVDADRFEIHEAAKALANNDNIDYLSALERLATEQEFAAPMED